MKWYWIGVAAFTVLMQSLILLGYFYGPRDEHGHLWSTDPEEYLIGSTIGLVIAVAVYAPMLRILVKQYLQATM